MDGKREGLETFQSKVVDARWRSFHFKQFHSRFIGRRQSYKRSEDRQADGFSTLYS